MQVFLDKGTLQGICNVLKDLDAVVRNFQDTCSKDSYNVNRLGILVITDRLGSKIMARVNDRAIVKECPSKYNNAVESLIAAEIPFLPLHCTPNLSWKYARTVQV